MSDRVLLTNGQLRKTLSVVRSLGKKHIEIYSAEETLMNISGFSRYCSKNLVYPSPIKKPDDFLEWLDRTIDKYSIDILFPMDDSAMALVIEQKDYLSKKVRFTVPDANQFEVASDKWKSVQMAKKAGLDCPITVLPKNIEDIENCIEKVGFPAIVKARKSSGSRGIRSVNSFSELIPAYKEVNDNFPCPILQQRVPTGPRFDVCLLFDNQSRLKASFAQKEIRHFPVEMGPSTVQQSIKLPEIVIKCTKMLQDIGWTGIAEVEFMLDESTGKYIFMEINPRFWNSLELGVHCGIDFPYYLYLITKGTDPGLAQAYEEGLYCRWLLPGDILHFILNKNRFAMTPPLLGGSAYKVHDDILSWTDPMPLAGFVAASVKYSLDPKMWKFFFKR
ncbi:MAG: ATP-grasp domain-containing protein [Herbinix sp.]|nr:ATP-grasp domain-containing protein [Herbinix sp.]